MELSANSRCDGQGDQQEAPHQLDSPMGLFAFFEFAVTVAGGCQGDGVKGGCVEGNHRQTVRLP